MPDEKPPRELIPGIVTGPGHFWRAKVKGTGVYPEVLVDMFEAGEHPDTVARAYGVTRSQVDAAIRWRLLSRHQRYRRLRKAGMPKGYRR